MRGDCRALLSEATCSQAPDGVRGGECPGGRERGELLALRAPGGLRARRERLSGCQLAGRDWQVGGRRASGLGSRGSWWLRLCTSLLGPSAAECLRWCLCLLPPGAPPSVREEGGRSRATFSSNSMPSLAPLGSWLAGQLSVSHFGGPTSGKGRREGEEVSVGSLLCTWRVDLRV